MNLTAKQPGGYDVIMASGMLGYVYDRYLIVNFANLKKILIYVCKNKFFWYNDTSTIPMYCHVLCTRTIL